jgi:hypothetical protein
VHAKRAMTHNTGDVNSKVTIAFFDVSAGTDAFDPKHGKLAAKALKAAVIGAFGFEASTKPCDYLAPPFLAPSRARSSLSSLTSSALSALLFNPNAPPGTVSTTVASLQSSSGQDSARGVQRQLPIMQKKGLQPAGFMFVDDCRIGPNLPGHKTHAIAPNV